MITPIEGRMTFFTQKYKATLYVPAKSVGDLQSSDYYVECLQELPAPRG